MELASGKKRDSGHRNRTTISCAQASEAALLKRARRKDVEAFEELVGRTEDKLYRVAMRYVRNQSDAQEILQNSYLSAWRSLPTFEGRAQFGCWMHRITVNASLMFLRARSRHPEVTISDVEPSELNDALEQARHGQCLRTDKSNRPDEEFATAELRQRIALAVDSLPQDLKSIFLLRDVCEESTGYSATKLKVSVPAAKTRLHRARRVLRQSLASYVAC